MNPSEHEDFEKLLSDSRWMRGLARRLVRDADVADDVVQDALTIAMEKRARVRGGLAPFLSGVIRRVACGARRSSARRSSRETLAARSATTELDVGEIAARLELQREVARLLLALDDPYRATLLLRYVEDLKPAAIAARQGVPVATVNSRLARGLALLRAQLDRVHGDRERWVRALAPFSVPHSVFGILATGVTIVNAKQWTMAAVFVAMLGAAAWSLRPANESDARSAIADAPSIGSVDAPNAVPNPEPVFDPPVREAVTVAAAQAPPTVPEFEHPCVVRVVRAEDRSPIEGAVVVAVEDGEIDRAERDRIAIRLTGGLAENLEVIAEGVPGARRTDERGQVEVEGLRVVTLVVAGGDRARRVRVESRTREVDVALDPPRFVVVHLLDPGGTPVKGVPVALCVRSRSGFHLPVLALRTDSSGIARFPSSIVESNSLVIDAGARGDSVVAMLGIPLPSREEIAVRPAGDEVSLRMPATASVRGRIRFEDGEAVPDGAIVFAAIQHEQRITTPFTASVVRGGIVEFERVACDQDLRMVADFVTTTSRSSAVQANHLVRTPLHPGEYTDFEWVVPRARIIGVRGRLVDVGGIPIRGANFTVAMKQYGHSTESGAKDGSFDSRFAVPIADPDPTPKEPWPVSISIWREEQVEVRAEIQSLSDDGAYADLGSITIPGPTVIAAGHVRDFAGEPVARADVMFVRRVDPPQSGWQPVPMFGFARTDGDGYFEFREAPTGSELYLAVRDDDLGILGEPIPFRPAMNLDLAAPAKSRLVGRLLLDSHVPADGLKLHFWDESKGPHSELRSGGWVRTLGEVEPGGGISAPELAPARYTVGIGDSGHGDAVEYLEGIVLDSPASRDPRLDPLDLRGRLRVIDLDVEDGSGNSIFADVFALNREGRVRQLGSSGRSIVVDRRIELETVVVRARGFCAVSLGDVDGFVRVRLDRGIEVAIEWPANEPVPTSPVRAFARLTPVDLTSFRGGNRAAELVFGTTEARGEFGGDRVATVRMPAAGAYAVEIYLEHDRDGYVDRAWVIEPRTPQIVSVAGSGAKFSVNAPAAAFEAARAKIGAK